MVSVKLGAKPHAGGTLPSSTSRTQRFAMAANEAAVRTKKIKEIQQQSTYKRSQTRLKPANVKRIIIHRVSPLQATMHGIAEDYTRDNSGFELLYSFTSPAGWRLIDPVTVELDAICRIQR
tara:strand:+ start:5452 stop:5814 length:363 start_codon:yes stop_codon:yes gene_type:complete